MDLPITARRMAAACRQLADATPCRNLNLATLVLFCALLLPFTLTYHRYPIPSFYQEWLAIFLALAAAILVASKNLGARFDLPFAAWIPLALLPSVLLHLAVGNDLIVHGPPLYLISIGSAVLLMIVGRKLGSPKEAIPLADVMAAALVTGALLSCVASWHWRFQTGVFDPLPWSPRGGWFGQRNQNALHIWLGVIGISHFVLNRKLSWFYFLVCIEMLTETAIYTQSRSVYLYAGCGLVLGVWAAARSSSRDTQRRLLLISFLPVIFLGAIQGARLLLDRDLGGDSDAIQRYAPATVSQDARLGLWLTASQITRANPWVGSGPGSFIRESWVLSDSLPSTVPMTVPATHAHNLFLQIGAELGAPTALAMAGLMLAWLVCALRQTDWERHWLHVAIPLAILTHNQVEFSLWYLFFLVPTALAMGAASPRTGGTVVPALAVLVVAVLGFGLAARLSQDYQVLEGVTEKSPAEHETLPSLLAAAKHPIFGAWASTSIATQAWPSGLTLQIKNWHAARSLYVVPLNKNVLRTHIDSLESAGNHSAAATDRRVSQRSLLTDPVLK
ncbi:MAG: Wzy polymerase domain-containing protein [Sulfuritalea sp.]|nr:Wzy polymerase domain-containing protein [Sulfuritalea sp.]